MYEPHFYVRGVLAGFGRERGPWGGPHDPDPLSRAARVQDEVARFVNDYLKSQKMSQSEFASHIGMPRPRLNRLLNGVLWARLPELEQLLGGCGASMAAVSWAIGDGHRQPEMIQRVIATYLHEQLMKVEGTARNEPVRPSTAGPLLSASPASESP